MLIEKPAFDGSLLSYNQSEFYPGGKIIKVAMGTIGFIYIPKECQGPNKCFLHVNFHGCNEWPYAFKTCVFILDTYRCC